MLFEFKKYDEDFFVEEQLGFDLKGEGDVFFVQFEKKDMNTMYVVAHLCEKFGIERKQLGISGLKDKNAITRQWISIYKSVLDTIGGTEKFVSVLEEIVTVIQTNWHDEPLAIGRHQYNHFKIFLRFNKVIDSQTKKDIEQKISEICKEGFPNCFGQQRFGKGNRNFKRATDILSEKKSAMKDAFEIRFKLQAFASMYFNHYVLMRWKSGQKIIQGDIVTNTFHAWKAKVGVYQDQKVHIFDYQKCKQQYTERVFFDPNFYQSIATYNPQKWIPTGLILGYNMLLCPNASKAFFKDWELIKKSNLLEHMDAIKKYNLRGIRRPLWVVPLNFNYQRKNTKNKYTTRKKDSKNKGNIKNTIKDLELSFTLPTGSYATVLIGHLFDTIDHTSCIQNKLLLPNEIK